MSSEQNKATVRRFYDEVINQKNLAVLDELYGDKYVSHDLPSERAALKRFIGSFHAAFPDGRITIDQMIAEGDSVALRATYRGTQTGALQDIPPTGKAVTVPAQDMYRLVEGKIVEHWGGPNQLSLLQQLGVVPAPEQAGA
jgi:predicted ester cyclase